MNVDEEKTDSPGGVESQTETKEDLRVVITINPTETATTTTAASQTDNTTTQTGKDQTDSMTSGSTDSVDSGDSGVVNQAYVEDETEQSSGSGKVSRKKGHQRSPSYSPNKDDEVMCSPALFFCVLLDADASLDFVHLLTHSLSLSISLWTVILCIMKQQT